VNFSASARAGDRRNRMLALDMTPMIDIVFQLLIFFLTTAQMADRSRVAMNLPAERGEQRESAESAGLIVSLPADGTILVSGQEVTLDRLEDIAADVLTSERIVSEGKSLPQPLIRADRDASSELLNEVLRRLQKAGFAAVRIGTSPPTSGGGS